MPEPLKKGNLVFLTTPFADLLYVVHSQEGEMVKCKKLDAPPNQWEILPLSHLTKLADEQEKLLPSLDEAIMKQRQSVFAPPKAGGKKKKSLAAMMKGLEKESLEDIFKVLAEAGIAEEE